ncbi:hypothetical protein [Vibrio amylolyticus]|uniref:hypothetical protein n=1 Tax=Vibrio amylolyticus TaxID=2847292 RepID=UPI0035592976
MQDNHLSIKNSNDGTYQSHEDLGFGLGLELTERLVAQYGWQYRAVSERNGWHVDVFF